MNYERTVVKMESKKDKFGRGESYVVYATDGTNKEILYTGGDGKKAYSIKYRAIKKLDEIKGR